MYIKKQQIQQLDKRISLFSSANLFPLPPTGWIRAIRLTLGMTLQQLANKLSITKQSVMELEIREREGAITIKSLRETAKALDMDLVYGFVPKDGSLEKLIDKKARHLAKVMVYRSLNKHVNSKEQIDQAIQIQTNQIKQTLPKALWNLT
jgi:predicted DNA-binding mobile mystery protein A